MTEPALTKFQPGFHYGSTNYTISHFKHCHCWNSTQPATLDQMPKPESGHASLQVFSGAENLEAACAVIDSSNLWYLAPPCYLPRRLCSIKSQDVKFPISSERLNLSFVLRIDPRLLREIWSWGWSLKNLLYTLYPPTHHPSHSSALALSRSLSLSPKLWRKSFQGLITSRSVSRYWDAFSIQSSLPSWVPMMPLRPSHVRILCRPPLLHSLYSSDYLMHF